MEPIKEVAFERTYDASHKTVWQAWTNPEMLKQWWGPNNVTIPGFSFAVYGDSRSMMYLPPKSEQKEEATNLFIDMFNLVLPEKISEEVVRKDVKLIYDPATGELVQIVMPFMTRSEVTTLTLDKGWVTEASVEDVKLLPGVHRTMFRLQGGEWVAREVAQAVKSGRAKFVLHTGDLVWWGKQGPAPSENPYWKLVNDVLKQLPAPDDQMRAAGLAGRRSRRSIPNGRTRNLLPRCSRAM